MYIGHVLVMVSMTVVYYYFIADRQYQRKLLHKKSHVVLILKRGYMFLLGLNRDLSEVSKQLPLDYAFFGMINNFVKAIM